MRREVGPVYRRVAAKKGAKKTIVTLARKLFIVAWRMLRTGEPYRAQKSATVECKLVGLQRLVRCQPADGEVIRREMLRSWTEAVKSTALRSGEKLQRAS